MKRTPCTLLSWAPSLALALTPWHTALTLAAQPAAESAPLAPATQLIGASQFQSFLRMHRGEFLVVNVWATFCVPCLKEIPTLVNLAREFAGQGLRLVGLAMDEPADLADRVEPFRRKFFPQFTSFLRNEADMDTLVSVLDPAWNEILPTTYLVGRDGRVVKRIQGGRASEDFRRIIEPLLQP